jgi:hypothetical protein
MNKKNPPIIDLGMAKRNTTDDKQLLNEWLDVLGAWIEHILGGMFGKSSLSGTVKGTQSEIQAFSNALAGEKRYMEAYKRYGLDNQATLNNKYKLEDAVRKFEQETKLKWPFK